MLLWLKKKGGEDISCYQQKEMKQFSGADAILITVFIR